MTMQRRATSTHLQPEGTEDAKGEEASVAAKAHVQERDQHRSLHKQDHRRHNTTPVSYRAHGGKVLVIM